MNTAIRVFDEFLFRLRRAGFEIATNEAIVAARALTKIEWARQTVHDTLASVFVSRREELPKFSHVFGDYFGRTHARTLRERLEEAGASESETDAVVALLEELAGAPGISDGTLALLQGGAPLDALLQLRATRQAFESIDSPLQVGFFTHQILRTVSHDRDRLTSRIREELLAKYGEQRGTQLLEIVVRGIALSEDVVRDVLTEKVTRQSHSLTGIASLPFAELDHAHYARVSAAVRSLGKKIAAGLRTRERRGKRGRIDMRATVRAAFSTGGIPVVILRKKRKRERPNLWVLCDTSASVRRASTLLLEFSHSAHQAFSKTRSFVFVSELAETTALFEDHSPAEALRLASVLVPATHNSNYGKALSQFKEKHGSELDRRSTVLILGDARTNYSPAAADALKEIASRASGVYWLATEPRSSWGIGDSAMRAYAPYCKRVFEVTDLRSLESAARVIAQRR